jgi:hypothetical protein
MSTSDATIDVTPLGFDHGGLAFGVAIFNASRHSANIDVTDITARIDGETLRVLTEAELVKRAQHRAMWAALAVTLVAGVGAAASASQRDHYYGSMSTPHGNYHWAYSAPSTGGQVAAAAYTAGGIYGVSQIQKQLGETVAGIGQNALQLTTVDPGQSYAGKIVLTKAKNNKWPQIVHLMIHWNGRDYPFDFDVGSDKRPAPKFADVEVPEAIGEAPAPVAAPAAPVSAVAAPAVAQAASAPASAPLPTAPASTDAAKSDLAKKAEFSNMKH